MARSEMTCPVCGRDCFRLAVLGVLIYLCICGFKEIRQTGR